jgi:plasmid stabilization system protein ParE
VSSYVLSAEAQHDLEEIAAFIALDSSEAARRVVTELLDAMQLLSEMPRIGVIRTSLAEADVRFWGAGRAAQLARSDAAADSPRLPLPGPD